MATVADRILDHLAGVPGGLDDGQLADALGARRQTVNQACRRLSEQGRLHRAPGAGGVIVNRLFNVTSSENGSARPSPVSTPAPEAPEAAAVPDVAEVPEAPGTPATVEAIEAVAAVESVEPPVASAATTESTAPAADAPSVPQARAAADDEVAPDATSEQARIPAARPGESEAAASIPAARTSAADDAPAGALVVPQDIDATATAPPAEDAAVPASAEDASAAAEDTAVTEPAGAPPPGAVPDVAVPDVAAPDVAAPENAEGPKDVDAPATPAAAGGRPWWKRLLPWGNG